MNNNSVRAVDKMATPEALGLFPRSTHDSSLSPKPHPLYCPPMLATAREPTSFKRLLGLVSSLLLAIACGPPSSPPLAPPDIVLVTFDTLRQDRVGAYGHERDLTPHLDLLASRGLVYDAAFTTMPTTAPAHMSLFTGWYPFEHGVRYNSDFPSVYGSQARNLVTQLHERGYATGCFITTQLFGHAGDSLDGFDHCDFPKEALRPGLDAAQAAAKWLRGSRTGPSFVWLHLYDPHAPYGSAEEKVARFPVNLARYGWIGPQEIKPEIRRRTIRRYERGIRDGDRALGVFMESIRDRQDDVLVIAVADHGEYLDEELSIGYAWAHGALLGDEVLRIPLVLAGPGVQKGRSATAVSIRDLYTTILEAAEIGDETASSEGRLDLRSLPKGRRIVSAERRTYSDHGRMLAMWGEEAWGHVRRNAVAAMDGEHLVVLGDQALPAATAEKLPKDLLAAARRHRAESLANPITRQPQKVDAESEDMLRALGYAN